MGALVSNRAARRQRSPSSAAIDDEFCRLARFACPPRTLTLFDCDFVVGAGLIGVGARRANRYRDEPSGSQDRCGGRAACGPTGSARADCAGADRSAASLGAASPARPPRTLKVCANRTAQPDARSGGVSGAEPAADPARDRINAASDCRGRSDKRSRASRRCENSRAAYDSADASSDGSANGTTGSEDRAAQGAAGDVCSADRAGHAASCRHAGHNVAGADAQAGARGAKPRSNAPSTAYDLARTTSEVTIFASRPANRV